MLRSLLFLVFGCATGDDATCPAGAGGACSEVSPQDLQRAHDLLDAGSRAIRKDFNWRAAHALGVKALGFAPREPAVRAFHASTLTATGNLTGALSLYRELQRSGSDDTAVLQGYVTVLHRLGLEDELTEVWPAIQAVPTVLWRSPLHCPDVVDPELLEHAKPFHDPADFEVTRVIARNAAKIKKDFQKFMSDGAKGFSPNQDVDLVEGGALQQWTEYIFFEKGVWDPLKCMNFRSVCKPLQGLLAVEGISHEKRAGQVSLLKLEPGSHLMPHFGSVNWRFVAQHGLQVPEGKVLIKAGGEERFMEQGKTFVFDDSFLHEVWYNGTKGVDLPRIMLFVNFFNPNATVMSEDDFYEQRYRAAQTKQRGAASQRHFGACTAMAAAAALSRAWS